MRRAQRGALLIATGVFMALAIMAINQVRAEETSPPVQAEADVQSRGFNLPNINVPPPPPSPSMQPLTVRTTGEGNGRVTFPPANACPPGCGANYPKGTPVVIAAVPAPGSTFAGWSGDCRGTAPCALMMDRAKAVEAKFNKIQVPDATARTQWMRWSQAAAGAARQEAVKWLKGATIDGALCKINLGQVYAPLGVLKSRYNFSGLVKQALQQAGAPDNVAQNWDAAFTTLLGYLVDPGQHSLPRIALVSDLLGVAGGDDRPPDAKCALSPLRLRLSRNGRVVSATSCRHHSDKDRNSG